MGTGLQVDGINKGCDKVKKSRKSINSRWLKSILAATVVILLTLAAVILYSVYNRYITTAELTIRARISSSVDSYFKYYDTEDEDMFAVGANNYVENFNYKDIMELLVLDSEGKTVVSTNAFGASSTALMLDYNEALKSDSRIGVCLNKTLTNEKVITLTYILRNDSGENYGALRFLCSMEDAYEQFIKVTILIILIFSLIILFITVSGSYFVSSIVKPVEKINEITKVIAKGDFTVRLENDSDDEIGELSESINEMANQLNQIDKMKNEFISTVSHEIRTPLTAIKGWGETLKSINNDPELTNKGLDIIISETLRLSDMVEELLDFSRMQNGNMKINYNVFDLVAVIDSVYLGYKQKAESESKQLIKDISDNAHLFIEGDQDKIRQVLINIIDNAIKYTEKDDVIKIGLERNEKYVTIYFIDSGKGISEEDLPHIKEKFYKADTTIRGTGIGLAVADEIVKNHDGKLDIESKIDEGTTVKITLPIYAMED